MGGGRWISRRRRDPPDKLPPGMAQVCLLHGTNGRWREAGLANEVAAEPQCVCRVADSERVRIDALNEAADDLHGIARRLRALSA